MCSAPGLQIWNGFVKIGPRAALLNIDKVGWEDGAREREREESARQRRRAAEHHFGNYNHISAEEIAGGAQRKLKLISGKVLLLWDVSHRQLFFFACMHAHAKSSPSNLTTLRYWLISRVSETLRRTGAVPHVCHKAARCVQGGTHVIRVGVWILNRHCVRHKSNEMLLASH